MRPFAERRDRRHSAAAHRQTGPNRHVLVGVSGPESKARRRMAQAAFGRKAATPPPPSPIKAQTFGLQGEGNRIWKFWIPILRRQTRQDSEIARWAWGGFQSCPWLCNKRHMRLSCRHGGDHPPLDVECPDKFFSSFWN